VSKRAKIIVAVVVLLVVAGAAAFFLLRSKGTGPVIKTAQVSEINLGVTVSASGKVTAGVRADVYPPTVGTLSDVYVKDGQPVKAGQKLATMDTGPLEMQVKQAKAGLASAQSQLAVINLQASSAADVKAAQASVDAAQAQYDAAVEAYDMAKKPPPPLPSNPASVAIAALNVKQAKAGLLGSKATLQKAQRGRNVSAQRNAAQAGVTSAAAAYSVAKTNLDNATLTAPVDGTVFFNAAGAPGADGQTPLPSVGAAVAPQAAPFSVANLNASVFTAEVDEADIDRLKLGMAASVTLDSFPGQSFKTTVTKIDSASQPTATGGTIFPVDLALENTGKNILIGMKGDATIEVSSIKNALTIPVEALFNENGKNFVYKVNSNKLVKTDITVGATTDTEVEILKGLTKGDVVALSGPTQYTDGMTVRVQ
jgi:RND family efflux transporter MFP subunit